MSDSRRDSKEEKLDLNRESKVHAIRKPDIDDVKYVLYTCDVFSDGFGDAQHLVDFVSYHQHIPEFSAFLPLVLISCATKNYSKIESMFRSKNIALSDRIYFILHDNFCLIDDDMFQKYIESNKAFENQLRKVNCMLNISTDTFDFNVDGNSIQKIFKKFLTEKGIYFPSQTICEQGRLHDFEIVSGRLRMGIGLGCIGFKYSKQTHVSEPAETLYNIKNKFFLSCLLGKEECSLAEEKKLSVPECKEFLEKTLIIPAYFQDRRVTEQFINGVSSCLLVEKYEKIIFILSNDQTYEDIHLYESKMSEKISSLTITQLLEEKVNHQHLLNPRCRAETSMGISVQLLEGCWLEDSDYERLLECAQLFIGCSGDNSFEKALFRIPLFHVKKEEVIEDLLIYTKKNFPENKYVHEYLEILLMSSTDSTIFNMAAGLSRALTTTFQKQWLEVAKDLHANHNAYNRMPVIAEKLLRKTRKSKESEAAHFLFFSLSKRPVELQECAIKKINLMELKGLASM